MTVKLQLATSSGLYGIHRQGQGFISTMSLERRDYAPVPKQKKKEKKRKEKKREVQEQQRSLGISTPLSITWNMIMMSQSYLTTSLPWKGSARAKSEDPAGARR